ncbi:MAG: DUF805 domain-containing protein [Campylobacter sp.]
MLERMLKFQGRASRLEYWCFVLFTIIFGLLAVLTDDIIESGYPKLQFVITIINLVLFLPSIVVSVRRLHDLNKSGL